MAEKLPPGFQEIEGESLINRRVRIWDEWKLHRKQKVKRGDSYEPTPRQLYDSLRHLKRKVEKLESKLKGCRCCHD